MSCFLNHDSSPVFDRRGAKRKRGGEVRDPKYRTSTLWLSTWPLKPLRQRFAVPPLLPRAGEEFSGSRRLFNILSALTFIAALALLVFALWIPIKAQVAQLLLQRAFTQSVATGKTVKPWSWADTWPVAEIRVPRLKASAIVLHGSTGEALAFGPTYLPDTPLPGTRGTSVLAAHRDTHFAFLKDVVIGDDVIVQRRDGLIFHFRITDSWVAKWNASGINRHAPGHNLVLSTCWPLDGVAQGEERLIVQAELVR